MEEILLKNRTLSGELVAEADEVNEVLLAELTGKDDFDTAFAEIAGLHDRFIGSVFDCGLTAIRNFADRSPLAGYGFATFSAAVVKR